MKIRKLLVLCLISLSSIQLSAQEVKSDETFGKTFNIGVGVAGYAGYFHYVGRSVPVLNLNYEIGVARNFTLAPFLGFYTYRNSYYYGDNKKNHPYKYYYYQETVVMTGVKGTYYFDELFKANVKWDFYASGSLGFAFTHSSWDSDYYGDKNYYRNANPLFLDLHIGAEYHFNSRLGAFLDLSTGVSTIGLAIH